MRLFALTFLSLICLAGAPATQPVTKPAGDDGDPVAAAKLKMNAAYGILTQANKQLDAATAAAEAVYNASPQGKLLLADVANKQAAMQAAKGGPAAASDQASDAYHLGSQALEAARSDSVSRDPSFIAAHAVFVQAKTAWAQSKSAWIAAKAEAQDAADPTAKHRREFGQGGKNPVFIKGMSEAEADVAAKTWGDHTPPTTRSVDDNKDGTRQVTYVFYWRDDPNPSRVVKLKFKHGVVIDIIADFQRMRGGVSVDPPQ